MSELVEAVKLSRHNLFNTHIIPVNFEYFAPKTLNEALELLDKYGKEAKILAGGTDLLVKMKMRLVEPKYIINIKGIRELNFIKDEGNQVRIGALTRWRQLEKSELIKNFFPSLYDAVKVMGGTQIRNMATVGGNLCNASPAADSAPPLMVLNAKLVLASKKGEREIPITQFFKGPRKTELRKDELLKEIVIPYEERSGQYYIKLGRRNAFTLSVVSVAALVKVDDNRFSDVRIALNSVAPTPVRSRSVEEALKNKEVTYEAIKEASKEVLKDISPISDVRASAEYRREMSVALTKDTLIGALKQLGIEVGGE